MSDQNASVELLAFIGLDNSCRLDHHKSALCATACTNDANELSLISNVALSSAFNNPCLRLNILDFAISFSIILFLFFN
jgi:hypothetical protein